MTDPDRHAEAEGMIDRVAKALIDADPSMSGHHEVHVESKRDAARAAIAAMQEPPVSVDYRELAEAAVREVDQGYTFRERVTIIADAMADAVAKERELCKIEIEMLTAERDGWKNACESMSLKADRLDAQVEMAKEALAPFATLELWTDTYPDGPLDATPTTREIPVEWVVRARDAVADAPAEKKAAGDFRRWKGAFTFEDET